MSPDDRMRLRHMVDAMNAASRFTTGRSINDLDEDEMLSIVGEAAAGVSVEIRNQYLQIPWALIIGMRNRLVHAYFAIDHDILWTTAKDDVPEMLDHLKALDLLS